MARVTIDQAALTEAANRAAQVWTAQTQKTINGLFDELAGQPFDVIQPRVDSQLELFDASVRTMIARNIANKVETILQGPLWQREDLPILLIVARLQAASDLVNFDDICRETSIDRDRTARTLERLLKAAYIIGIDARTFGGFDLLDIRLTERGLRAVGEWPSDAVSAFVADLRRQAADASSRGDSEQADAINALRDLALKVSAPALESALRAAEATD